MTRRTTWVVGIVAAVAVGGVSALKITAPTSPAATFLGSAHIVVMPTTERPGEISAAVAEAKARLAFPRLNPMTRMAVELVVFSNRGVARLQKPEPAWVVTWNQTSWPQGPLASRVPVKPYRHMNVVVNAVKGSVLEIFPSP
ncbi:hypothetical protein [Sulfobacillus harzensis]|uniref:Uncharacterized protein n=1 Tax=Sulfobacillus harzensis TaxID=2729629 RepID=A0A7Y0L2D3_9FIRM|nr:hypothetical protein [Sulfobacillus harzensis]NMP22032.1 hypothetical protein [Sulfobacillus harzensis]